MGPPTGGGRAVAPAPAGGARRPAGRVPRPAERRGDGAAALRRSAPGPARLGHRPPSPRSTAIRSSPPTPSAEKGVRGPDPPVPRADRGVRPRPGGLPRGAGSGGPLIAGTDAAGVRAGASTTSRPGGAPRPVLGWPGPTHPSAPSRRRWRTGRSASAPPSGPSTGSSGGARSTATGFGRWQPTASAWSGRDSRTGRSGPPRRSRRWCAGRRPPALRECAGPARGPPPAGRPAPYGGSARARTWAVFRASRPHKGAAEGPRGRRKVGPVREGTSEGGTG